MSLIKDSGDPQSPIWVVLSEPYANDMGEGIILSGGYGYNFRKVWRLSGIPITSYITSLRPCIGATYDTQTRFYKLLTEQIEIYKPPFIIAMGDELLNLFCPETRQRNEETSALGKWAGSLLTCNAINYPHFIVGTNTPDYITRNWDQHEIQGFIELGRIREEYYYYKTSGVLQNLPIRNIVVEPSYSDLVNYLLYCRNQPIVSIDIETIRPKKDTYYNKLKHPGYPMTTALAPSEKEAMCFCFWDYSPEQAIKIWRIYADILANVPQIGQNYYNFDATVQERMGWSLCLDKFHDTLIRHHILWPGLPHSLQFMTKQYTRQPYYKDEAQGFNWKMKRQIMRYNGMDSCVTFEVFLRQEEEFASKPHLK